MNRYFAGFLAFMFTMKASAQDRTDTLRLLEEVMVKAYFTEQPVLRVPGSISVLGSRQMQNQPSVSLVSSLNTVPGVRMEERSPGSYRLSIRGSLLRSPFGVRNVKIYMDEFPITDPGGNTYLNLLDAGSVNRMEILKGPESSIFGANSGGVILIHPFLIQRDSNAISAAVNGGSYGLFYEKVAAQKQWNNSYLALNQAYQTFDGYRQNSDMKRNFGQAVYQWKYSKTAQLRSLLLYSDLNYHTPLGLTAVQMQQNPRSARPASGALPGAIEQRAGIKNSTVLGGVLNEMAISPDFRHVLALFGSHTAFQNPFINNYEVRDEANAGIRTYFELKKRPAEVDLRWQLGLESGHNSSDIDTYDNNRGIRGNIQSSYRLKANYTFLFTHFSAAVQNWYLEAAASLNFYDYKYGNRLPVPESLQKKRFNDELMPRVAVSYRISDDLFWRASASKGYSPPTIAEVTGSNNVINTELQPEQGWNYETGLRYRGLSDRIYLDVALFRYNLKDAIVRRANEDGSTFFVNAGGTKQVGLESQLNAWLIKPTGAGLLRSMQLNNSLTLSDFHFVDYQNTAGNFSGNRLTGVPRQVVVSSIDMGFPQGLYFFFQYNYTSSIPLNDANTDFAGAYNLVQCKTGWRKGWGKKHVDLFAGVDNLLNTKYSLGNDINAAGGRYFNPAPVRNYYFGLTVSFK